MAYKTKDQFISAYLSATGLYKNNTTGDITPSRLRDGLQDTWDTWTSGSGISVAYHDQIYVGDVTNNNYSKLDGSGFYQSYGSGQVFDDLRFPFIGERLDSPAGHVDYDFDENTVDFDTSADETDRICIISQMPHSIATGTEIHPHLHWIQQESGVPAFKMDYRIYENGAQVPTWITGVSLNNHLFPYVSGNMLQISEFPVLSGCLNTGICVSWFADVRIYRMSSQDSYSASAKSKEFDLHIVKDGYGSRREFYK